MTSKRLAVLTLFLIAFIGVTGYVLFRLSLPPSGNEIAVEGLGSRITIRYDQWQRPYVQARTLDDALTAQGWLHATHRLWQMELYRRAGKARMAELLGSELLETDEQLLRFGVPQLAKKLAANASGEMKQRVEAYLNGVNAAIKAYTVMPPEFLLLGHQVSSWQEDDVYALGALMAFQSANNANKELIRLALRSALDDEHFELFLADDSSRDNYPFVLPDQPSGETGVPPAAELAAARLSTTELLNALDTLATTDPGHNPLMPRLAFGSNGWVVAPGRSGSGHALYAFDSHDSLGLPNLFYEVHLFFGEGKQLRGWSTPGLPGVINGYNENIAWGFTNIGDTQDVLVETRSTQNPEMFLDDDKWYRAQIEKYTVPVKGQANQVVSITRTRNGPLISEDPPLALRWTIQDIGALGLDAVFAFNLASNWEEFNAALDLHAAPTLNATYADVHGTIGFRTAGLLPLRSKGDGLLPLDGSQSENRWRGMIPAQHMPRATNPAAGFIAAANGRVNPANSYPLVSAENAAPYRIQRIQQVLSAATELQASDMQALQYDWYDGQAALLLPSLLSSLQAEDLDAAAQLALAVMQEWQTNPVAGRDSAAALIFQAWYLRLADEVFAAALAPALYSKLLGFGYGLNMALDTLILTDDHQRWWQPSRDLQVSAAFQSTVSELAKELGTNLENWRLDQRQQVGLQHELSKAVPALRFLLSEKLHPWGGSPAAVGRASYSYRKPFQVSQGATVRAVAEMSSPPKMKSVIPGGQSGHPLSAHYTDQFSGWLEGDLFEIATEPDSVGGVSVILLPVAGP